MRRGRLFRRIGRRRGRSWTWRLRLKRDKMKNNIIPRW